MSNQRYPPNREQRTAGLLIVGVVIIIIGLIIEGIKALFH